MFRSSALCSALFFKDSAPAACAKWTGDVFPVPNGQQGLVHTLKSIILPPTATRVRMTRSTAPPPLWFSLGNTGCESPSFLSLRVPGSRRGGHLERGRGPSYRPPLAGGGSLPPRSSPRDPPAASRRLWVSHVEGEACTPLRLPELGIGVNYHVNKVLAAEVCV